MIRFLLSLIFRGQAREPEAFDSLPTCTLWTPPVPGGE